MIIVTRERFQFAFSQLVAGLMLLMVAGEAIVAAPTWTGRESNVAQTNHDLGSIPGSTAGGAVCIFCHTPHGGDTSIIGAPLWNRDPSIANYTNLYDSASLDNTATAPEGTSKLCLSCHDGTIAVGTTYSGRALGLDKMGQGNLSNQAGALIGTDLTNDHPISISYSVSATADDEIFTMQDPVGIRTIGQPMPTIPLEKTGAQEDEIQCATCHDPHINRNTALDVVGDALSSIDYEIKFLRLNRFQRAAPPNDDGSFNDSNDIICLACHDKNGWFDSAHASSSVAGETYTTGASGGSVERDFPEGIAVWQAACLNCHDTHTETGAERLLRAGADSSSDPAIEETCYQCHGDNGGAGRAITSAALSATAGVPNIQAEFEKAVHMPITSAHQTATSTDTPPVPVHNISDEEFSETAALLGSGNKKNRHVECTDCHNPHRVIKNSRFDGTGTNRRTHVSGGTAANNGTDGNIASGVLRGAWGIDCTGASVSTSTIFPEEPTCTSNEVKKGLPSVSGTGCTGALDERGCDHLTREYQLCFKCHSNYSLDSTDMPTVPQSGGTTASNANGMTEFTNVAAEFTAVAANDARTGVDQGEGSAVGTSPSGTGSTGRDDNNHRSWHPVIFPTGRTASNRNISGTLNFKAPWVTNLGLQTMTCSDCHGGETSYTQGSGLDDTKVQGPHGSTRKFILKQDSANVWTGGGLGSGTSLNGSLGLCGNCHQPTANSNGTGFDTNGAHLGDDGKMGNENCMMCHVAVPHGWKNKSFLVNLLCVGPTEAPDYGGAECSSAGSYSNYDEVNEQPYYNRARLRVPQWRRSGNWASGACGGSRMEDESCPET